MNFHFKENIPQKSVNLNLVFEENVKYENSVLVKLN